MAGDEIAWEQYCLETKGRILKWRDYWSDKERTEDNQKFLDHYRYTYRRQYNLPMATAIQLGCDRVDISEDGNSNDNIALSTISYLLNRPIEERKQYHVCIGWTSTCRFIKYIEGVSNSYNSHYSNLHVTHVGGEHCQPELRRIQYYIDASFRALSDEDLWLNFVKNVMLLESFLINNGITYTFYKALGTINDVRSIGPFEPFKFVIPNDKVTNDSNWYNFKPLHYEESKHPYENDSWTTTVLEFGDYWVSEENTHPNLKAVGDFSKDLANFIRNQNVLSTVSE